MADTELLPASESPALPEPVELAKRALEVPAAMLVELACNIESPLTVAGRYGFTEEEFGALTQWEPFIRQLDAKRKELSQTGYTFRLQNGFYAEDVGKDLYVLAKSNDIPFSQKLDAYKTFTRFAGLEPQPNAGATAAGGGFNIVIQFPETSRPPVQTTYEVKAEPVVVELPAADKPPVPTDG